MRSGHSWHSKKLRLANDSEFPVSVTQGSIWTLSKGIHIVTGDKGSADGESRPQMMLESGSNGLTRIIDAELVQSVERQFRNLHVGGSIPPFGSK